MACSSSKPLLPIEAGTDASGTGKSDSGASTSRCPQGQTLCDERCVATQLDPRHCGACSKACPSDQVCNGNGLCAATCPSYLVKCDNRCIDPEQDRARCGASGSCESASKGAACEAGQVCSDGACTLDCGPGLLRCGDVCINPQEDLNHCGASGDCAGDKAGDACPVGQRCSTGTCALSCGEDLLTCEGRCIDPDRDDRFCGASADCAGDTQGAACEPGHVCSNGACALTCAEPNIACDRGCIDPSLDERFCGAVAGCGEGSGSAGVICDQGHQCINSRCTPVCPRGQVYCGTQCIDPNTHALYCGASGDCVASAGEACSRSEICDGTGHCSAQCANGFERCGNLCTPSDQCPACGAGGACDVDDLGGATCESLNMGTGMLLCDAQTCTFDTSMCSNGGGGSGGSGGAGG